MINKSILKSIVTKFNNQDLNKVIDRNESLNFLDIQKSYSIIWPRRSGKTYICYSKINELIENGISKKNILYINLNTRLIFK